MNSVDTGWWWYEGKPVFSLNLMGRPVKTSIRILRPSTAVSLGFVSDWRWVCSGRDGAHLLSRTFTSSCCFSFCVVCHLALLLEGFRAFLGESWIRS